MRLLRPGPPTLLSQHNTSTRQVTELDGDVAAFDIIVETLRATNLHALTPGAAVNFERSARVGDEIGGHNVSGHVHTTAAVTRVEESPNNRRMTFEVRSVCFRQVQHVLLSCLPRCETGSWLPYAALSCSLIIGFTDSKNTLKFNENLWVKVEPRWMKYILAKGFIAVDGISLTARALLYYIAQRLALLMIWSIIASGLN